MMGTSNKEHPWLPHCPGDMADILLLSYLRMCCVKGKIVIAAAEKNKQIKRSLTMSNVTLPLLATCFYIKIYRVACSQQSIFHGDVFQTSEFRSAEEKKVYSRNMRAAKTISIFVAVFFSCWIPFSFISLVSNLCDTRCVQNIPQEVFVLFLMFGYLNSALYPFRLSQQQIQIPHVGAVAITEVPVIEV